MFNSATPNTRTGEADDWKRNENGLLESKNLSVFKFKRIIGIKYLFYKPAEFGIEN
jgi:hypothetical protein